MTVFLLDRHVAAMAEAFRFAMAGGHWVTLGGGDDADEGGAVHVYISGGVVTKGPKGLIGSNLGHVEHHHMASGGTVKHHPEGHEPPGAKAHPHYTEHEPPEPKPGKPHAREYGAEQTRQDRTPPPKSSDETASALASAKAAVAPKTKTPTLPALTGSEKQIEWAQRIRDEGLAKLAEHRKGMEAMFAKMPAVARQRLLHAYDADAQWVTEHNEASWWINVARDLGGSALFGLAQKARDKAKADQEWQATNQSRIEQERTERHATATRLRHDWQDLKAQRAALPKEPFSAHAPLLAKMADLDARHRKLLLGQGIEEALARG